MTAHVFGHSRIAQLRMSVLILALCSSAFAGVVSVQVIDASGAPLKNVLVIVQDLRVRDADEVFRVLSDEQGRIPPRDLPSGNYRIISTTPYGLWTTDIREVVVGADPTSITATLYPVGTHGYGDTFPTPEAHFVAQVKQKDGQPAEGALLLVRDKDASLATRHWYRTDNAGKAAVVASGNDLVLVVFFRGKVLTHPFTANELLRSHTLTIDLP